LKKKSAQPKKVLGDYKKQGSTFIPPMTHQLGKMKEASYARQTLPELIWWDVLADQVSAQFAIDVAGEIGKHLKDRKEKQCWWAFASDFKKLSDDDFNKLKDDLEAKRMLKPLQRGLDSFLHLYPECPLWRFMPARPGGAVDLKYLDRFEDRFEELRDKRSRNGVLMQAQAVYLGFVLGRLKVFKGLALADFPEVSKYPDTQRSLEVGASICAAVNLAAAQMLPEYADDEWVLYFWQRSFDLRPFKFDHLEVI
jgi:hypothetical protein